MSAGRPTGTDLRLYGVGRPGRGLCQVVNDVEFGCLDIRAHCEAQVHETLAAADEGIDVGQAGRIAQDVLLRFDDIGLHLLGCRWLTQPFAARQKLDTEI